MCHVFATFAPGGPQVRTCRLLNAARQRCRHTILAMDGDTSARVLLRPGLAVSFSDPPPVGPLQALRLARLLRGLRPDLLLTCNWGSMDAAFGAALGRVRPWIHLEETIPRDEIAGEKRRRRLARRILLRGAHALVVPSTTLRRRAIASWHLPPHRVIHIPNGVDTAFFHPAPAEDLKATLGLPREALVIGTLAHLRPEKDPLGLLASFAALAGAFPSAHLLFVGSGALERPLRRRIAELGLESRVHLSGFIEQPREHLRLMEIFALSSHSEQMPLALLEAMACGCAVASTAVGDIHTCVAAPNRPFITPPGDRPAFTAALARLLSDAKLRAELARANRERVVAAFGAESMRAAWRELVARALKSGSQRPR